MNPKEAEALATIRAAGIRGIDAWRIESGMRVQAFSPIVIASLVADDLVEIAQDSRRPVCATCYRAKGQ